MLIYGVWSGTCSNMWCIGHICVTHMWGCSLVARTGPETHCNPTICCRLPTGGWRGDWYCATYHIRLSRPDFHVGWIIGFNGVVYTTHPHDQFYIIIWSDLGSSLSLAVGWDIGLPIDTHTYTYQHTQLYNNNTHTIYDYFPEVPCRFVCISQHIKCFSLRTLINMFSDVWPHTHTVIWHRHTRPTNNNHITQTTTTTQHSHKHTQSNNTTQTQTKQHQTITNTQTNNNSRLTRQTTHTTNTKPSTKQTQSNNTHKQPNTTQHTQPNTNNQHTLNRNNQITLNTHNHITLNTNNHITLNTTNHITLNTH